MKPEFLDKITCWQQLQPNHLELSNQLQTAIPLFPPTEATYPTYVDFDAAMKLLDHHKSRKRMTVMKRMKRKQDKYQLRVWDHHAGQV